MPPAERHLEPADELSIHRNPRWIRGIRDGETVIDSRQALLVWRPPRRVPSYAFPRDDVTAGVEARADPALDGYVIVRYDAVDRWLEEEEEVFIHPRDPFHRVDALRSSRHIRIECGGVLLAQSTRPVLLFETGLPTRYYLPQEDYDSSLLAASSTQTGCPYKGTASYFDVVIGNERHSDLIWCYRDPLAEVAAIAGLLAPYTERAEVWVDGGRL
jgi:uncharacterized protein (DUF427 family)